MKTKFLILPILAFLISPLFAQESEIIDYPHNLQEFYEKLDEAFPDDTVITSESFDDWDYFYSIPYWDFIRDNVVSTNNSLFLQTINPHGYKIKDHSYIDILTECYWSYKNGKDFDFDTRFEKQEAIDFPPPVDYPHTLQKFYEKLDDKFPEYTTDIMSLTLDDFINKYYWTDLGLCISNYINFNENADFLNNINPNGYRVHKESYRSLLMGSYWSHITGKDYDLDFQFELDDRYLNSYNEPTKFPLNDLVWDNSWLLFEYEYKTSSTYEAIYDYRRPSDPTDSNVYIYSYHFGWIVLTGKEYNDMLASPDCKTIIWNYFKTKEKLVF